MDINTIVKMKRNVGAIKDQFNLLCTRQNTLTYSYIYESGTPGFLYLCVVCFAIFHLKKYFIKELF